MTNSSTTASFNYADLLNTMSKLRPAPRLDILCHPENLKRLAALNAPLGALDSLYSVPVYESQHLPRFGKKKKWKFASDPFVEYEAKDEGWARPVGYGEEVEVDDPDKRVAYAINRDVFDAKSEYGFCPMSVDYTPRLPRFGISV